jgi:hypothetical protein
MKNVFLFLIATLFSLVHAADSLTTLSIEGTYSEGDFGTDYTTKAYYMPVVATYNRGQFSTSITVPYIKLDSEGSVTWTDGGLVPISPTKPSEARSTLASTKAYDPFALPDDNTLTPTKTDGLGDILLNVGYTFLPANKILLKTSAIMKIATADENKGLGTGEHDYSAQVDLFSSQEQVFFGASAGYTLTGDTDLYAYNDVFYGALFAGYNIAYGFHTGVSYYYRQALFDSVDETQSVSPYLSYKVLDTLKLQLRYTRGLSDSTADNAYTLKLIYKL